MDPIEKNFRDRPRNPLSIRHYVRSLLEDGRILEASFYFSLLFEVDPTSIETNKLGYLLAIKRFDNDVAEFDKALHKAGASHEEIYSLQLAYYLAFDQRRHIIDCSDYLVDVELKDTFSFNVLIQAIETTGNYDLARRFATNHYTRITPAPKLDQILRRILICRLGELLRAL